MNKGFRLAPLMLAAALSGCTWVTPNPDALNADIKVLDAAAAAKCQNLTQNQLTVQDKIGGLQRMPTDVEQDLQTTAINQAATVGANAVASLSELKGGTQTWGIYKCPAGTTSASGPTTAPASTTGVKTIPYSPPR